MHTYYYIGELENVITLNEVESNHAIKVMRTTLGGEVRVINGKGFVAVGKIVKDHAKRCEVQIEDVKFKPQSGQQISIAIAPTKSNDRIEFFIEKATEIGVHKVYPLLCKNNERDRVKVERWRKVALSATKQSLRVWMPIITAPIKFSDLMKEVDLPEVKLIAYCEDLPEKSINNFAGNTNILILIGPEGDFTKQEVREAEDKGFVRVNLGENRLRTETAGLYALSRIIQ